MRRFLGVVIVALAVMLVLSACANIGTRMEDGDFVAELDLELPEQTLQFNQLNVTDDIVMRDAVTDVGDGELVVNGDIECADGTVAPGSVTMTMLAAADGQLEAEIVDVESTCLSIDDPAIAEANEAMARAFGQVAQQQSEQDAEIDFTSVDLSNDTLTLGVRVRAPIGGSGG